MSRTLVLYAMLSTGCLRATQFECSDNSQCGANGRCESVGFCSFPDTSCGTSGRIFGDSSGQFSGQCVGSVTQDGGTDAPTGSEPLPMGCPATGYSPLASGANKYKVVGPSPWVTLRDLCSSEMTYLAIPNDATELSGIVGLNAGATTWVGINDIVTEGSFRTSLNMAATFLPWASGEPDNQMDQDCVAGLATTISTEKCSTSFKGVCECTP